VFVVVDMSKRMKKAVCDANTLLFSRLEKVEAKKILRDHHVK